MNNKQTSYYKSRMQNLSKTNRSNTLEKDMSLFTKSLQNSKETKKNIPSKTQEYFDKMLEFYGENIDYELIDSDITGVDCAKLNGRVKKRKRIDTNVNMFHVGILWSTGLDSTVLKEKLTEQRKELRITKLYCFFFTKANERKGSNREREALARIKLKQNYNEKYKQNFARIIELDCPAPKKGTNLFENHDIHSFHGHNQWMLGQAVVHSLEHNLGINKFIYDVDCDNNDCFCDTDEAYKSFQTFISNLTHNSIQLERFKCIEESDYLYVKKQKIDYLKQLDLWDSISFCYSTRYASRNLTKETNSFHPFSCGKCTKCSDYQKAIAF